MNFISFNLFLKGDPNCDEPDVDSCFCKQGYVMVDNECILQSTCNTDCVAPDGSVYKVKIAKFDSLLTWINICIFNLKLGEEWLQKQCKERCECKPNQRLECKPHPGCTSDNQVCSKAGGVEACACEKGYELQDDGSCADINECTDGTDRCSVNAECFNEEPDYKCVCKPGFIGDGFECKERSYFLLSIVKKQQNYTAIFFLEYSTTLPIWI